MSYCIAICNKDVSQTQQIVEMLHIYENEYNTNFKIHTYKELLSLPTSPCDMKYDIIFLNIQQGGQPNELSLVYTLHKQNPTAALFSICPTSNYKYYHELAYETAFMCPPFSYSVLKKNLYKIIKDINIKILKDNWSEKYVNIQTKYKEEYIERERIEYITIKRHNITIHTLERDYVTFTDSAIKQLPIQYPNTFFYANRYCIFNINYLYNLEKVKRFSSLCRRKLADYYIVTPSFFFIPIKRKLYHHLLPQFINQTLTNEKILP